MRALRRCAAALASVLVGLLAVVALGGPAHAASDDSYDTFNVAYVVGTDGVTHVTETFTYNFSPSSLRHGYDRILVVGEQYDDTHDVRYEVSNITVSSPDPISTAWERTDYTDGRNQSIRIRIGDANRTISARTAHYVISYDLRGALRPFSDHDEFYWDALGPDLGLVKNAQVTVTVPQGAQDAVCFAGAAQTTTPCTSDKVESGVAVFTQKPLAAGQILTVDVRLLKGAAGDAQPIIVDSAAVVAQREATYGVAAGLGVGALVPLGTWLWGRRRFRDQRFVGLPPGTVPVKGDQGTVGPDPGYEVPVAFSPPDLALMDAGYLLEGQSRVAHLTATLVGLATAGAIRLSGGTESGTHPVAIPLDRSRIPDRPSDYLFDQLFAGRVQVAELDERGSLADAKTSMFERAAKTAWQQKWFVRFGAAPASGLLLTMGVLALGGAVLALVAGFFGLAAFAAPVGVALLITGGVVRSRTGRGQRSAYGRALTDQVQGFRTYLGTAEADQLRFEEGEDVFSRFLPWAVLFGLAERWTKVCERAVELGLMAAPDAGWYGGGSWNPGWILWNLDAWGNSIDTSTTPLPSPAASSGSFGGTGFGGGSSGFGGGGFSGGGGGGGGGGGW